MKVWIVKATSYSPSYGDDGYRESTSIAKVCSTREKADAFLELVKPKYYSTWSTTYEIEDEDGTDVD